MQPEDLTGGWPCATDSLLSQQCSFSKVIICGTVVEVHENTSDIPVTKDSLNVAAGCNVNRGIYGGKKASEYHDKKNATYRANLQN